MRIRTDAQFEEGIELADELKDRVLDKDEREYCTALLVLLSEYYGANLPGLE